MNLPPGAKRIWYIFDSIACLSYTTTYNCPIRDSFIGDSFTTVFSDTGHYTLGIRTVDSANNLIANAGEFEGYFCVIYCPPVSYFRLSELSICAGDCIQYTDSSGGYPPGRYWAFEGGEPASYSGISPPPVCYADTGTYTTMLIAIGLYSSDTSYQTVTVHGCGDCLYVPNAFTPNHDGINDTFRAFSDCQYSYYNLRIYDRWGEKVFESDDISEGWDGDFMGHPCLPGIYTYEISSSFHADGMKEKRKGSITLLR